MSTQTTKKELIPHVVKWQVAYAARELRQKKTITLSCFTTEASALIEELKTYSNCSPIMKKSIFEPNSNKVFVEIVDVV